MAIRSVNEMMAAAREEIDNVSPVEAKRRIDEDGALLVDIRDVRELQGHGVIPGAMHAPRGMLEFWIDPASPYHKPEFAEDREYIFQCAAGSRSSLTVKMLQDMGMENISHVDTGFQGWQAAGLPVQDYDEWKAARH